MGIRHRLASLADGNSVLHQKPHPDLFRFAAAQLGLPANHCLVVEDAAAGIEAAIAAGMPALALGPADRFDALLVNGRFSRRDNLEAVTVAELTAAIQLNPNWHVVQDHFDASEQRHKETIFTLGNGYFASRGTFEESYPGDSAISFAHGVFDDMPVSFTELVNLPNWLDLNIVVDGYDFRLDKGEILNFHRYLDLQQGILYRNILWQTPHGKVIDLHFERFASYVHEQVGALRVLATAVSDACDIIIYAGINGHVSNEDLLHWHLLEQGQTEDGVIWLQGRTRHTKIEMGTAVSVQTNGAETQFQNCPGHPRIMVQQTLPAGQTLQVDKLAGFTFSRDLTDNNDVVARACAVADQQSYDALRIAQTAAWVQLWQDGDVIIEGDPEAQLAVRFNLFQLLVAAPQKDDRVSIGAKTLSGYGYRGHVFWDTEIFILPFFMAVFPQMARNMLMYRYHTLAGARRKAARNEFAGAQFAWESAITGDEMTPTWVPHFSDPTKLVRIWTGDIQIHISADVAYAIMQYWRTTGDDAFVRDYGAEIILDSARFWGSRAELEEHETGRHYAFRDVIGPDEYHDHVDNNSFTNYIARWHLQIALHLLTWLKAHYPEKAKQLMTDLQITDEVLAHWQDVIENILFFYDEESGLIDQFEGFFELEEVPLDFIEQAEKSLQVIFGIEGANERQVLKQADVIMLLCLFRDQFDRKTWQTNWDTYMPKTDHVYGSSLGPSFHAWAACEMDRPEEAYEHFMLAARADLFNPRGNAGDGIHAASAGGVWQAVVFGFAGFRLSEDGYTLRPNLPSHWQRLAFNYQIQGERHRINLVRGEGGDVIVENLTLA